MNYSYSKDELRAVYKAVIKALIVYHGFKHTHVAALIGMRVDTFSKWFRNCNRSLTVEEMKLFCYGLNIPNELIETLVELTIHFKKKDGLFGNQLVEISHSEKGNLLKTTLGEDGYLKVIPAIFSYLAEPKTANELLS